MFEDYVFRESREEVMSSKLLAIGEKGSFRTYKRTYHT